ncbi:MAG: cysteine synthase A [Armatimonadetes bacterium]|nr:cysteine synthase A [Armatimonadota bacterium]
MRVYEDNSYSIGNTPLVRLNKLTRGCGATVLVKTEGRNPAYSVKCRVGASMIWDGEARGLIKPGTRIVEPTSGNTGIALAFVCAARGYDCVLTMPETMSLERRKVLQALGAEIVLTPGAEGMRGAIKRAEEIVAEDPDRHYLPQQFKNPANPAIHERTTGPEIWHDTEGRVDVVVSCVGTGGTITGIGRHLKKISHHPVTMVAVEPKNSPVIAQTLAGETPVPGAHKIQGMGAGFVPDVLDLSIIDRVEHVVDEEAFETARRLATDEGILCGISSGAAAAVAIRLAGMEEFAGKMIVAILPDLGERYLSTDLFKVAAD